MPAKSDSKQAKIRALAEEGALNPEPGKVQDTKFHEVRVLRSARHRAGQVRDAAPRIGREGVGDQCDRRVRGVEADLLSDQSQLRGSGDRRISAQEAGPARSTQGAGRSAGIYPRETDGGRTSSSAPAGRAIRKKFDLDIHPRTIERAVAVKKTVR